jgi:predicted nucleotidyltransferase
MQHEEVVKQIRRVVKEIDNTASVILFGSRARGDARSDSDWDVLILVNKPHASIKDEQLFRHKLYELELCIGEPISTFVYSLQEWNTRLSQTPLYKSIQREGMIL